MANIIGLTGQTGAGKSSVRELLRKKGAAVIDADSVSHDITENNLSCITDIVMHFSVAVLNDKGTINRKALGKKVFADKKELLTLNKIIFPYIMEAIEHEVQRAETAGAQHVVIDGATLIESGCDKMCNFMLSVTAPKEIRAKRIVNRDKISKEDAERRIDAQKPEEFYTENSDFVINNEGSKEELEQKVNTVLKNMLNKVPSTKAEE